MSAPTFEQPEYGYKLDKHNGHLVAYLPREAKTVQFQSMDPNKPEPRNVDGAVCTVICVDCEKEYDDVFAGQTRIAPALRPRLGQKVLARVRQDGRAWVLDPFTPADAKRAADYWATRNGGQAQASTQESASAGEGRDGAAIDALKEQLGAEVVS